MLMTMYFKERCPKQLLMDSITNEWARNIEVKNATVKGKNKSKGLDRRIALERSSQRRDTDIDRRAHATARG